MNELSNFDIDEIVKKSKIKNFHGCFSKDVLPTKMNNGFYVINLADDKDAGSHWTALYKFNDEITFYYDSFGFPPPKINVVFLLKVLYNGPVVELYPK